MSNFQEGSIGSKDRIPRRYREYTDCVIKEAEEVGLEVISYGCSYDSVEEEGVHIWKFRVPREKTEELVEFKWTDEIKEFLVHADDSQPYSCYTDYFGDVWMFVPFYS